ncbi:unnamed protein product [Rotaria socialis]
MVDVLSDFSCRRMIETTSDSRRKAGYPPTVSKLHTVEGQANRPDFRYVLFLRWRVQFLASYFNYEQR